MQSSRRPVDGLPEGCRAGSAVGVGEVKVIGPSRRKLSFWRRLDTAKKQSRPICDVNSTGTIRRVGMICSVWSVWHRGQGMITLSLPVKLGTLPSRSTDGTT